jgi:hypothetical protein
MAMNPYANLTSGMTPEQQRQMYMAQNNLDSALSPIELTSYKGIAAPPSAAAGLAKALQAYSASKSMRPNAQTFDKNSVFSKPSVGDFAQHPMQSLSNLFR